MNATVLKEVDGRQCCLGSTKGIYNSVAGWGKGECLVRTDCVSVCMCVAVLSILLVHARRTNFCPAHVYIEPGRNINKTKKQYFKKNYYIYVKNYIYINI